MKNAHSGTAVVPGGIEARVWNGRAILRRQADGFVNATAMCRAGGKRWNNYARAERTSEYICALAAQIGHEIPCAAAVARFSATGIPGLIDVIKGGRPELQGTWIHPRLAVDLARWISPSFAVWMDGWLLEAMGVVAAPPAPQPAPRPTPRPTPASLAAMGDPVASMSHEELRASSGYLPGLLAHRQEIPEANDLIRAFAQHLLLSCDPLPTPGRMEQALIGWGALMAVRHGTPLQRAEALAGRTVGQQKLRR